MENIATGRKNYVRGFVGMSQDREKERDRENEERGREGREGQEMRGEEIASCILFCIHPIGLPLRNFTVFLFPFLISLLPLLRLFLVISFPHFSLLLFSFPYPFHPHVSLLKGHLDKRRSKERREG